MFLQDLHVEIAFARPSGPGDMAEPGSSKTEAGAAVGKGIIAQRLFHGLADPVGHLAERHLPQPGLDVLHLTERFLAAFAGMDGLEHETDLVHLAIENTGEGTAVLVHCATLPANIRKDLASRFQ